MKNKLIITTLVAITLVSCATVDLVKEENITIAKVQKNIKIGMTSEQVIEILGSPNIVTTDTERQETWVYDKVSTNSQVSASNTNLFLALFGIVGAKGSNSSNQRTLTIIIKFDKNNLVRDFSYKTSTF